MQYRKLGKTGLKASALGFGCMRLPKLATKPEVIDKKASLKLFRRAYELGVNFYDSAYIYDKGENEKTLGLFLKEIPRGKVIVSTKNWVAHSWMPIPADKPLKKLWREALEKELKRLHTDYIDIYNFHDIALVIFRTIISGPHGLLEEARKAKKEGLIRHIGFSSHDTPTNIIEILKKTESIVDMIIVQYNLLDRKNEVVIDHARKQGVGVAIMGPIGGGRLIHPSEIYQKTVKAKSTPEIALRFVLSNPGVSIAMSGMNSREQLEENVEVASRKELLRKEEVIKVQERNLEFLNLYCTGCRYCMPCPQGINIPGNFEAMNLLKVHGLIPLAKKRYEELKEGKAEKCKKCGKCEGKCPQHILIQEKLEEVANAFTSLK